MGSISGREDVGGLAGFSIEGSISNCYSTGAVSGSSNSDDVGGLVGYNYQSGISNCYSTGTVGGNVDVGGLAGYSDEGSILINCYSTGTVSGSSAFVGGLVGYNYDGSISNCYSTGAVSGFSNSLAVGGLVGYHETGDIRNCYSTGQVSGYSGSQEVGGLVGYNWDGSISVSFWDVNTSGWSTSAGGTGKTTAEMKTKSTFTDAGWDFENVWNIGEDLTYPFLRNMPNPLRFNLTFPLQNRNAYNARITTLFDHSMLNSYCPDDNMVTFSGEETTLKTSYSPIDPIGCGPLYSFYKPGGGAFLVGKVNYVGSGKEENNFVLQYDAHPGYDCPDDLGSPVLAAAEGDLSVVDENSGHVKIIHDGVGSGYETHYLHLNSHIGPGRVTRGQVIGGVGHKGEATGNHLHFEVRHNSIPVDPYGWEGSGTDPYTTFTGEVNVRLWETLNTVNLGIDFLLGSPADMVVTDPDGLRISKDLNQISGAAYDEVDIDGDGDLEDRVSILHKKMGEYLMDVIPESNALPTDTYSLEAVIGGQTIVLAEDVQIQNIPPQPYEVKSRLNPADFDDDGDVDWVDLAKLGLYWLTEDCNYPDWCEGTDLNYNGRVDFNDFAIFAENWLWEKIPADIDIDGDVDFVDYAIFANHWMDDTCCDPNWCEGTDFDKSGSVDMLDLATFARYWLEGI
jgi:hypothetical protein